jgi:hypothetical protein
MKQCKYCENEAVHVKLGLCEECYFDYLDGQAAQDEYDRYYGSDEDSERM